MKKTEAEIRELIAMLLHDARVARAAGNDQVGLILTGYVCALRWALGESPDLDRIVVTGRARCDAQRKAAAN